MNVVYWFKAERPGKFEFSCGGGVVEVVYWNAGDVVWVLEDGTRMVSRPSV